MLGKLVDHHAGAGRLAHTNHSTANAFGTNMHSNDDSRKQRWHALILVEGKACKVASLELDC